jgi:4-diphosphocytidyl-2-C-methyl-D-erythritol kinase
LHVRGRREDGRHEIETVFAFCVDGDSIKGESVEGSEPSFTFDVTGPFAAELGTAPNLVEAAWQALAEVSGVQRQTGLRLDKRLPVASGIGGGSADAAAALRLLTSLWGTDPSHASAVAPSLGADVPACLLSLPARGTGAGDEIEPIADFDGSGTPVLLVNPRVALSTAEVFAQWDGVDQGPLGHWRDGFNGLQATAITLVPQIETVLAWLEAQPGADLVRMSGSGATCFALFESEATRNHAAEAVPREWWHLATALR